jgi:hypothetical protein
MIPETRFMQRRTEARSSPPEDDSRFPDLRQELRSFAEATELAEAPRSELLSKPAQRAGRAQPVGPVLLDALIRADRPSERENDSSFLQDAS